MWDLPALCALCGLSALGRRRTRFLRMASTPRLANLMVYGPKRSCGRRG
ncbi:hypothetical protein TPMD04_6 [Thiohalocapsa phage LS06-2018-MD04]|nr:hypothetical protein TPMD04_6 [Thiohalocapsa phage LS06-2018-MD04]